MAWSRCYDVLMM